MLNAIQLIRKLTFPQKTQSNLGAIKILIVEDYKITQMLMKIILNNIGCMVETVGTGKGALELLKHTTYDLIFMDIGLPDSNGLDISAQIRSNKQQIPIVFLTAYSDHAYKKRAEEIQTNAYIEKPVTHNDVYLKILEKFIPDFKKRARLNPNSFHVYD